MRVMCRLMLLMLAALPLDAIADCYLSDTAANVTKYGYDAVLRNLAEHSCLGDKSADQYPLVVKFNELTPDKKAAIPRLNELLAALNLLGNYADERAATPVQANAWLALSYELKDMSTRLARLTGITSTSDLGKSWPAKWDISQTGTIVLLGTKYDLLAHLGCADTAKECKAFESQRDMIRVVNLVERLRGYSQWDSLAEQYADAQTQMARWDAYRTQGQHQYIWEVWLNGQNMGSDLCPRDAGTGIQRGFCKVPESQWVVLHPEVGLRWASSAEKSSDLKPALLVEVLGKAWWDWDGRDHATMTNLRGISLVAAYTNEPSGSKWSYGPMVHIGAGYNLAITRSSSGYWGLTVSLNLADRYFGRKEAFVNYLKCLDKPSLGSLLQEQNLCE